MRKEPVVQALTITVSAAITVCVLNTAAGIFNLEPAQAQSNGSGPLYTFEGNKRMYGQKPEPAGMQEYQWRSTADSSNGDHIVEGQDYSSKVVSVRPGSRTKSDAKPATTVVQLLGPDGKLHYKEVKFCGELFTNTNATMSTVVRDKEGGVREYSWVKKKTASKPQGPECHIKYGPDWK